MNNVYDPEIASATREIAIEQENIAGFSDKHKNLPFRSSLRSGKSF